MSNDEDWKATDLIHAMDLIMFDVVSIRDPDEKMKEFDYWGKYEADKMAPFLTQDMYTLDFGGGIGRVAKHVAPLVKEVVVSDISQNMLDIGKAEWCTNIDNIAWQLNVDHIPFPDDTFDFAYSLLCVWHLLVGSHDARYWFGEIERVLKPGGLFYYDMDKDRNLVPHMELITKFKKYPDQETMCYLFKKGLE